MKYILLAGLLLISAGTVGLFTRGADSDMPSTASEDETFIVTVDELENYIVDAADYIDAEKLVAAASGQLLTESEIEGVLLMREEEKLAHDVYRYLSDLWGVAIFDNIAQSESTHMEAMRVLLEKNNLTDPVQAQPGVFTNTELQGLYDELVAKGSESVASAYVVGATIEDLDIYDLTNLLATVQSTDVHTVYESLLRGSRNHLRAFNRQIANNSGSNYVPVYIPEEMFESIIAGPVERGGGRSQNGAGNQATRQTNR